MFTGLVEICAEAVSLKKSGSGYKLAVAPSQSYQVAIGDSVSVNGACLTVVSNQNIIEFDVSPETATHSTLGALKIGEWVNLERALRPMDRLGGHFVTGHVDSVGSIKGKRQDKQYTFFTVAIPTETLSFFVHKGSVAVDGVSLTVNALNHDSFSVAAIPHTIENTNLRYRKVGDRVNIETDIIGKYVLQFLEKNQDATLLKKLKEHGFM
jgi:riboflavin synthase